MRTRRLSSSAGCESFSQLVRTLSDYVRSAMKAVRRNSYGPRQSFAVGSPASTQPLQPPSIDSTLV